MARTEERAQIEAIVTRFGGRYLPHLLLETTHLIALEPLGEKYTYARDWSIPVVHRDWLDARIHSRGARAVKHGQHGFSLQKT